MDRCTSSPSAFFEALESLVIWRSFYSFIYYCNFSFLSVNLNNVPSLKYCHVCIGSCFLLMVAMITKLVLWTHTFDVISNRAAGTYWSRLITNPDNCKSGCLVIFKGQIKCHSGSFASFQWPFLGLWSSFLESCLQYSPCVATFDIHVVLSSSQSLCSPYHHWVSLLHTLSNHYLLMPGKHVLWSFKIENTIMRNIINTFLTFVKQNLNSMPLNQTSLLFFMNAF